MWQLSDKYIVSLLYIGKLNYGFICVLITTGSFTFSVIFKKFERKNFFKKTNPATYRALAISLYCNY